MKRRLTKGALEWKRSHGPDIWPPVNKTRVEGGTFDNCEFCGSDARRRWIFFDKKTCSNEYCLSHYLKSHELSYIRGLLE